jgi:topoisomerase IV subunit A
VSVAAIGDQVVVQGTGRGGKAKVETLKGAALEAHVGKRARKGKALAGIKGVRVVAG